jgi:hypothetical protein
MKNLYLHICLTLIFLSSILAVFSQDVNTLKFNSEQPLLFTPKSHDPNFLKSAKLSTRSFYQRKSDWQHIIDSTWGPGYPYAEKLQMFNDFAKKMHDYSDYLNSPELNFDSLCNHYRSKINESTSRGGFAAIMSHFAYAFQDMHTWANDSTVVFSTLNPGVPVLLLGNMQSTQHFGANTTVLPDSTTLVLRVIPNHPLNLEPGDIVLGYEGIPWKRLVKELLEAGVPLTGRVGGCKTAYTYQSLMGAELNWHMFNTIDILKYSTGDTLHLSVLPLLKLNLPPISNNEQMPIPNIPFPKIAPYGYPVLPDTVVTYGILENTNIGYIFLALEIPSETSNMQFFNAVNALKNTDALVIDMRWNGGGYANFEKAFPILFNESQTTLQYAKRCNTDSFELCPITEDLSEMKINGSNPDFYDRPIAVLLGPSCFSWGDITAQRLRYHPMVKFFGASSNGSFGYQYHISKPGWYIEYSVADAFHVSGPGIYLNKKEFPIDYPVWFNKDDVAKGIDPIVEKSLQWIKNLTYGKNVRTDKWLYIPGKDTVKVQANIENPNDHQVSARLIFESLDGIIIDSTEMSKVNVNEDSIWQGKWKLPENQEKTYWISLKVKNLTDGTSFNTKHATRITTVPLLVDNLLCTSKSTTKFTFQAYLKNAGKSTQINSITLNVTSNDACVKGISPQKIYGTYLKAGQIAKMTPFNVSYDAATYPGYINLKLTISSDGWPYWVKDTTITMPTGINPGLSLPLANCLDQNYPNPFNSNTTIGWQLAHSSKATIKVFDLVGREVAIPVDEQRPAGKYETKFNAATIPKGVYFYQLKAGEFVQTRKMILMK